MDFVYLGEVMVTQEKFPAFLALARDLGVRGLTGATPDIDRRLQQAKDTSSFMDMTKEGRVEYMADVVKTEPQEEEQAKVQEGEFLEDSCEDTLVIAEERFEGALVIAGEDDITRITKEEKVKLRVQQRLINAERKLMPNSTEIDLVEQSAVNAELDNKISEMIVKSEGGWSCAVCGKMANHKSKLKQHAETHLQGYSHPCALCGKTYRSRNVLRMHMSRDHRSKGHMDPLVNPDTAKQAAKCDAFQYQTAIQYHPTVQKAPTVSSEEVVVQQPQQLPQIHSGNLEEQLEEKEEQPAPVM